MPAWRPSPRPACRTSFQLPRPDPLPDLPPEEAEEEEGSLGHATGCSVWVTPLLPRDRMEEGAGDVAAPAAGLAERVSLPVDEIDQGLVVTRCDQRRVVKFVAAYRGAGRTERTCRDEARLAIAKMQLADGKTRSVSQQAGHGMTRAAGGL